MCQTKTGEAGLIGWCHHAIGAWVGLAHLDTSFGPQLIRGLPIFLLGIWNQLFPNSSRALWLPSTLVILKTSSGLLQSSWAPLYIPLPRGHTLMLYEVSKSLPQPMVSLGDLDITKPHPDTSREGWGAIHMICWEKRGIFKATKGLSKLICHPHLSKSTQMGHMAVRVCLLQTCSCRTIQGFILFSLTFHYYLVFNILPGIPSW